MSKQDSFISSIYKTMEGIMAQKGLAELPLFSFVLGADKAKLIVAINGKRTVYMFY